MFFNWLAEKPARWVQASLALIFMFSLAMHLMGWRRDLPYTSEINEPAYADRALRIAASGKPDALHLRAPASTVVYPLALVYKLLSLGDRHLKIFRTPMDLTLRFQPTDAKYYYLGRMLSVFYGWASLLLLFLLGRRVFSEKISLAGCALYAGYVVPVSSAQLMQPEAAIIFYSLLALLALRHLWEKFTWQGQILAGLAIGLAAATHYPLALLAGLLLAVDLGVVRRRQGRLSAGEWAPMATGLLMASLIFFIFQPQWLRHFSSCFQALHQEIQAQTNAISLGSWWKNIFWYLTRPIRWDMGGLQIQLALLGILFLRWPNAWMLRLWPALALGLLAVPASRIQTAIIILLPVLALWSGAMAMAIAVFLANQMKLKTPGRVILNFMLLLLLAWPPVVNMLKTQWPRMHYSTRIAAREWAIQNLPAGSKIAQDWFTAPALGAEKNFQVWEQNTMSNTSLEQYRSQGFTYFMTCDWIKQPYLRQPQQYPRESAFYQALQAQGQVLQMFSPSGSRPGPTITVYALQAGPSKP